MALSLWNQVRFQAWGVKNVSNRLICRLQDFEPTSGVGPVIRPKNSLLPRTPYLRSESGLPGRCCVRSAALNECRRSTHGGRTGSSMAEWFNWDMGRRIPPRVAVDRDLTDFYSE